MSGSSIIRGVEAVIISRKADSWLTTGASCAEWSRPRQPDLPQGGIILPKWTYRRYLASREWGLKKRAVAERSGGICERCHRNPANQVHHLSYEHLYNEPLEDLQHICGPCHEYESGLTDFDPAIPLPSPMNEREWREFIASPEARILGL